MNLMRTMYNPRATIARRFGYVLNSGTRENLKSIQGTMSGLQSRLCYIPKVMVSEMIEL
jgi:hypothetical protein